MSLYVLDQDFSTIPTVVGLGISEASTVSQTSETLQIIKKLAKPTIYLQAVSAESSEFAGRHGTTLVFIIKALCGEKKREAIFWAGEPGGSKE